MKIEDLRGYELVTLDEQQMMKGGGNDITGKAIHVPEIPVRVERGDTFKLNKSHGNTTYIIKIDARDSARVSVKICNCECSN